ncbi:MAG: isocitrate lyase/phosphoenolpyruvate mutase family protein, partial [Candidatus Ornithospirochaeta sp.]
KRLAEAGASAVMIDDTTGIRGWERQLYQDTRQYEVIAEEKWLSKLKAAMKACEGTDCLLIARTESKFKYGMDEAIKRCLDAESIGAPMTLAIGIRGMEDAKKLAAAVHGSKMYPDIKSSKGVADINLDEVKPLGFDLVTLHFMEKAVEFGIMDYALQNVKNRSTVYSDTHDMNHVMDSLPKGSFSTYKKWLDMEKEFNGGGV